ncbi:class I SAM-dependent methyltransferase [Rhodoferax mekongensis]|uniref:Class I SAM-dependent methyltransferase n=1 Tax=Rhodoferax mekongensis TaxID=3068341 RepID=A0ABZ0AVH9_9BURK|nr:class I SAM-dependent methyltransferase [Rhodoferax sp. TBRC 17307]WNO03660.1 class I SAM-dependent methyltransferase [Rhodoferax sp. TBRC 17307]
MLSSPHSVGTPPSAAPRPLVHWTEHGQPCSALWRSERDAAAPAKVVLADDTMTADAAYQLACGGTALLWRGDFNNARQLLQALQRRIDTPPRRKNRGVTPNKTPPASADVAMDPQVFHLHRQAQAQRARILAMVLLPFDAVYAIPLRRAPDAKLACTQAWGAAAVDEPASVASLRDLLGMRSASEWRKNGVEIAALGIGPDNRIYPHYGVFSPVRGEYIDLVAAAPLPAQSGKDVRNALPFVAFDIGTGSGVLSAVLARRQDMHIVATDQDARAMACATENFARLGVTAGIDLQQTDMFPAGRANLVVCNPPWLPARPSAPVEYAVYDENSRMLLAFLAGLPAHLREGGEGWLIISDLAERLGLRSATMLADAIGAAGLVVLGRCDARPQHAKALDVQDALHRARSREVTTLWRLGVAPATLQ